MFIKIKHQLKKFSIAYNYEQIIFIESTMYVIPLFDELLLTANERKVLFSKFVLHVKYRNNLNRVGNNIIDVILH